MHRKRNTIEDTTPTTTPTITGPTKTSKHKIYVVIALVGVSVLLILISQTSNNRDIGDNGVIQQALSRVYHGDLLQLRQLMEGHPHIDWQQLQKQLKTRSFMHTALHGRHSTIHSNTLVGDHEAIIQYLLTDANWSAQEGCILYHAVHYRNVVALRYLLAHLKDTQSLECIVRLDAAGETAWHTAAKSMASGFGRFYSKLMDSNGIARAPNKRVAEILGLSEAAPKQVVPGQVTMAAMNNVIQDTDFTLLLHHYGNHLNLSLLLNMRGNNLLHIASYGGRLSLVRALMERGVSPYVRNNHGWTAIDYASIAGHGQIVDILTAERGAVSDASDAVSHSLTLGDTVSHDARLSTLALSRYVKSGWSDKNIAAISRQHSMVSDIPVIDGSKIDDLSKYFEEMRARMRPYILTNVFNDWPAWDKWQKEHLLQRYGDLRFTISMIPYEDHYRASPVPVNITLRDYIDTFSTHSDRPMYAFDGKILGRQRSLYEEAPIPSFIDSSSVYLRQFILGPRNSGAPPHFHGHAINGLVYGVKEWFFWQPADAYFSTQHIVDWRKTVDDGSASLIKAIQYPGELVYVPENWGHAVINREDSIGVAYEFY